MSDQLIPRTKEEFLLQLPVRIVIVGDFTTRTIRIDGVLLNPETSQRLVNHSPDGFNWGYQGSGPSQLALAILLQFTDGATACQYYQDFKRAFISNLPQSDFREVVDLRQVMKRALRDH